VIFSERDCGRIAIRLDVLHRERRSGGAIRPIARRLRVDNPAYVKKIVLAASAENEMR